MSATSWLCDHRQTSSFFGLGRYVHTRSGTQPACLFCVHPGLTEHCRLHLPPASITQVPPLAWVSVCLLPLVPCPKKAPGRRGTSTLAQCLVPEGGSCFRMPVALRSSGLFRPYLLNLCSGNTGLPLPRATVKVTVLPKAEHYLTSISWLWLSA